VELGRHEGATLFMTLLAVYQTLLRRSTGAETVIVGTPVANRHPLAIEGLIGFFVNTLAIGADFTGRPTFRQILARVRQAALGAYAHQELPFEKLVETLYPNRQTGVQPVFQSMFALGDLQLDPVTVPGLTFRPLPAAAQGERGAAFELSCGVTQAGDRLSIQLDYDRSLFYSNTIETLLERFVRLADEVAADPDRPIAEIEIMSEAEEQAILQAASAPAIDDSTSPTDPSQAPGEDALAAEKRNESKLRAKVTGRKKGLSDAKRALLAKRLKGRKKKKGAPSPDAIPRRSPDAPAPLSFSQERLWFLDQLEPGGSTYNMTLPLRLRNRLDRAALEASFDELWRRHEITRTRFRAVDGVPVQVIDPPRRRALPLVDFGALGAADRRGQVERWIAAEVEGSFDLTRGPLVRVLLMRTSADAGDEAEEHIVLFNIHHIACDGWSMGILTSELGALYQSCAGRSGKAWRSPLAELPIQYADYASWQRGWLQGAELERQLGYWQRQLGDAAQVLELPTDRPRPAIQTFRGVAARQQLDGDFADRLRALSRTADTTLFVTLLSPFAALLGRLAGQRDVLIGTPIAGRSRSQLEGLVGMFLNTLVMRADLADNPTFRQLLGRLREVSLEAYGHQDLPFEKLLEALTPERDLSRTPVFQVFFNLLNLGRVRSPAVPGEGAPTAAQAAAKSDGSYLVIEDLQEDGDAFEVASKFDLTLYVDDHARELTIDWVYNADLFDPARIQAMAAQYENLLRQMVADPDTSIDTVPLLNDAARTLLPDPTRPLSDRFEGTVAEVFARCAAESPDGVAVVDPEVTLTYGTLAAASADLARSLRDLDVAPGDVVAIYGHRSAPLVAALLGTLGAGAAFLILDPAYPAARGVACLSQAEPRGFVHLQAAGDLPAEITDALDATGCPRLMLGSEALATETATPTPPTSRGADDLACIAFTSGSTGLPKGIRGRHGSLTHFIPWQREAFDLRGNDRYSLLSGLAHDPLHREVFTPLQTGATVVIPPPEILEMAGRPARWMGRQRITQAHLTPALGQLLVGQATGDTRPAASLPALRGAYYVGDVLTRHDVGRLQALAPAVRVINYYGSTETQRAVGYHEVAQSTSDVSQESEVIAVGRGMPDVQLLVLATDDRLAGIGEVGEICVRSPHLALGYLADDELTAARFVANPFASAADPTGDRLYRTGDLGRYRPDGEVEIVGRADRQVKIRGFRVELGEIEANLAGHPEVREAVVIRRTDAGGQGYLVAYVTGLGEPLPATASRELRDFLRQRLPDPIVPSFYMGLEALPLTPNRKVDRDALPAPEAARSATYVAPRTPAEEVLVELWREVLGLTKEFGVEDSFFELGGHSLLAAQLIARVQRAFDGVEIPLRQLFEAPTIAAQATAVTQAQGRGTGQLTELPPLVHDAENRFEPFPMTEVQEAYWVGRTGAFELGNVATHSYMEIELDLDLERLERVWQRLIEHHDMLRAVMLPDGRQKVLAEVPPYRIATLDLRGRSPEEAEQAIAEVRGELSHQVLDPEVWPLFDLRATRLADDAVRLHISRDLLIYDAWSSAVLFDQLMELYRQPERPLQPLEITFRDYVMAERGDRDSPQYQRAVAYWQGRLDTLPPAPELPLATSAAALERPRFERHAGRLVAATWRAVRQRGSRFGLTPSAVLLAAYAEALAAYCKSPRFTLNLTLFNRQPRHPQVNHLVGDFTSLTLLETDCRPGDSFLQLARRLQQQLWDDLDHRAVGGVWVQRQLARQGGGAPRAGMPVVFTSTLGLTGLDDEAGPDGEAPSGNEAPAGVEPEGEAGDLAGGQLMFNITQTPQVWLDQQISERDGQLFFTWDSVAGLFPDGLVGAMFEAYEDLLNRLEQEDTWLDRRQTLTPAAQLELVARANDTAQPVPQGLLHRPFLEQAAQHPEHTAVVAGGERLTYGEIEQLSARYARRLQQLGARPNQLVAVVMEKGWQQVAAVLAICRSGAAYQPIEASLPAERRQRLLERGEVEIALTQPHFAETLDWPDGLRVLAVERSTSGADDEPVSKLTTQPSDLAYVIFTSGSTGEPKGVMIDHRSALNTVIDVNQRFAIGA
ncbi:MAG: amino acid adenylation domain-containing protein, partial [Acidobacteriota bacterium]